MQPQNQVQGPLKALPKHQPLVSDIHRTSATPQGISPKESIEGIHFTKPVTIHFTSVIYQEIWRRMEILYGLSEAQHLYRDRPLSLAPD